MTDAHRRGRARETEGKRRRKQNGEITPEKKPVSATEVEKMSETAGESESQSVRQSAE